MDSQRFLHLRDFIRYDNPRLAAMLRVDITDVEAFCRGTKDIPDTLAKELEDFADWSSELSHTTTKRELAQVYLNGDGKN